MNGLRSMTVIFCQKITKIKRCLSHIVNTTFYTSFSFPPRAEKNIAYHYGENWSCSTSRRFGNIDDDCRHDSDFATEELSIVSTESFADVVSVASTLIPK
mmetsp:Transcript_23607/g.55935  ORF Transcript_23607/g.55935 Transcript_23607/m.55935 type:complete len:100 (+) Transcript_23607:3-302(+)